MNARLPKSVLPLAATSSAEKETTVFMSGNSQAVRIPKEFQLATKHVKVRREGNSLVISPKPMTAAEALADLPPLSKEEAEEWRKVMEEIYASRRVDRAFGDAEYQAWLKTKKAMTAKKSASTKTPTTKRSGRRSVQSA